MNKFATTLAFALVAATAAVSAQAADQSQSVFDRAQRVEQPAWQRAVAADQNFAAQPDAQPGRRAYAFRAVQPVADTQAADTNRVVRAVNAPQNYAAQINTQPGRVVSN
ncbi:hypothetical protein [Amantichitinum ursilacus]|uniref:Uncharacterized protein n=1 Tax=Amantichitinum ursilacus TaxID=857265 RepID=A0A0N0GQL8_9NEIS|nr:hypothetical protein [Amantichitinum ursilacus]KPC54760.1 hypothetical protein WG78_04285 [Amantichitinum ursilacus]